VATYLVSALEGSNVLQIDMLAIGPLLKHGHVIGHDNSGYLVDDIVYDTLGIATITVTPPLRRNVAAGDPVFFRPWFTGSIANPGEFRTTYDAEMVGHIQLEKIILNEVIVP
jgi:hypothetical protein